MPTSVDCPPNALGGATVLPRLGLMYNFFSRGGGGGSGQPGNPPGYTTGGGGGGPDPRPP